jgi:hypothetical protein
MQMTDRLLFILVYQKTQALQTMHGLQFGLSQPQANCDPQGAGPHATRGSSSVSAP